MPTQKFMESRCQWRQAAVVYGCPSAPTRYCERSQYGPLCILRHRQQDVGYDTLCEKRLAKRRPWSGLRAGCDCSRRIPQTRATLKPPELQFFGHWYRDLLPRFSVRELPFRELALIETFHEPTPGEQRAQTVSFVGNLWGWDSAERRCAWHDRTRNAEHNNKIHYKTSQRISSPVSSITLAVAALP